MTFDTRLLDVRRIGQHELQEIAGRFRTDDLSFEAMLDQLRQQTGVIDVGRA